jgi:hypothetical protein
MKTVLTLPKGYRETLKIDLQSDRRTLLLVNGLAVVLMLAMAVPAHFFAVSVFTMLDLSSLSNYILRFGVLIGGMVAYLFLHEWVHGIFMKKYSGVKAHYGFTGFYAYAGSSAYFCKRHFIVIALAPVVVWGAVLAVATALVPKAWFWVAYFIQVINVSGAAGDFYVVWKLRRMPSDLLVRDTGVSLTVYDRT